MRPAANVRLVAGRENLELRASFEPAPTSIKGDKIDVCDDPVFSFDQSKIYPVQDKIEPLKWKKYRIERYDGLRK